MVSYSATPIRPIERTDLVEINKWYKDRLMEHPHEELLPPQGLIWPDVAAGYMIKTDANIVFLEHFIANPRASKRLKEIAIEAIIRQFVTSALSQGYLAIYGITNSQKMAEYVKSLGFVKTPSYEMFVYRR